MTDKARIKALENAHWQVDAMQQNALLNDALTRAETAEAKLARLENDNYRWKMECEEFWRKREDAAEAKLAKAFALLKKAHTYITDLEEHEGAEGFSTSTAVAMGEYYDALTELEKTE
jgi:hypothetical protein